MLFGPCSYLVYLLISNACTHIGQLPEWKDNLHTMIAAPLYSCISTFIIILQFGGMKPERSLGEWSLSPWIPGKDSPTELHPQILNFFVINRLRIPKYSINTQLASYTVSLLLPKLSGPATELPFLFTELFSHMYLAKSPFSGLARVH